VSRLRFGIFMAPFHAPPGQNPTTALARDVATIKLLDELGYDEAWVGEHHSCGTELIASPEIFIAHVASQTQHIKLGTGVLSLPYHNPLWVADRAILLDHLLRGRFMLGLGPGALPTDAAMIGIDPADQRQALEEDTEVLVQLLRSDEPVTKKTARYNLIEARRRGLVWRGSTACRCCRSAPPWSATSTSWPCTGTWPRSAPPSSAPRSPARAGAWSGRCTSPRRGSRR
jgi:limonene 1,2-monooxygenase